MICGSCVDRPEVRVCPQCRITLAGRLSRNRVLENLAMKIFPQEGIPVQDSIDKVTVQEVIDTVTEQEVIDTVTEQEVREVAASEHVRVARLPTYDDMGFPDYGLYRH